MDSLYLDEDRLLDYLEEIQAQNEFLLEYHCSELFPERWFDLIIVLRTDNSVLYDRLVEKGYNPINQIVGYILSEDPTYITTHNNARSLIRKIDRDELLQELVRTYLNN